jgi:hypothetical protein
VKKLALLIAMHRVVRRVKVQHDFLGRFRKRIEERIDEKPLQLLRVMRDLFIPAFRGRILPG